MRRVSKNAYTELYYWGCNPSFVATSDGQCERKPADTARKPDTKKHDNAKKPDSKKPTDTAQSHRDKR